MGCTSSQREENPHVPSCHLQQLPEDHLGRMRPAHRAGQGRRAAGPVVHLRHSIAPACRFPVLPAPLRAGADRNLRLHPDTEKRVGDLISAEVTHTFLVRPAHSPRRAEPTGTTIHECIGITSDQPKSWIAASVDTIFGSFLLTSRLLLTFIPQISPMRRFFIVARIGVLAHLNPLSGATDRAF